LTFVSTRSSSNESELISLEDTKKARYANPTLKPESYAKQPMSEEKKAFLSSRKKEKRKQDSLDIESDSVQPDVGNSLNSCLVQEERDTESDSLQPIESKKLSKQQIAGLMYEHMGRPSMEEIVQQKVTSKILKLFNWYKGCYGRTKMYLARLARGEALRKKRNFSSKIETDGLEIEMAAQVLNLGLSVTDATIFVNEARETLGKSAVSPSTVRRATRMSECIETSRRQTKKSGKIDSESTWAKARKRQCEQMRYQLALGRGLVGADQDIPPLYLDGIAFWDEHHR
jgi:hypothetical protein